MSQLKYCQGPKCHTYDTKDRKRGPKDNKRNETRRRSSMNYGKGNFCSLGCYNDWAEVFSDRAIDHFGRVTQPIVLTSDNAWCKRYDWRSREDGGYQHYVYNHLTDERRNITEQQFNNANTITDDGRLAI